MEYQTFPSGPIETNVYVLYTASGEAAIVDPVLFSDAMNRWIAGKKLSVKAVLLTHAHADHNYEAEKTAAFFKVPVFLHPGAEKIRDFFENSCVKLGFARKTMLTGYQPLEDGRQIALGPETLTAITTPGHTPCGVAFECANLLVTGDVLFQGGIGRYDLPGASLPLLYQSLKKIMALKGDRVVLPGHGPSTTLEEERASNPYLQAVSGGRKWE